MNENRITYRNLGEIFVMQIEDKNIEVHTMEGLPGRFGLDPFNKYVVIKNIYKHPEKVKEYAEACQFTNHWGTVGSAPILRTYAPITNVIQDIINMVINESFNREVKSGRGVDIAIFSYYSPQAIEYHQYQEPHIDGPNWLPLATQLPKDVREGPELRGGGTFDTRGDSIAGVIFLDETYGTEILVNKNKSYYYNEAKNSEWATADWHKFNMNYYPAGNDSHYEHIKTIGGEYNSAVFYYSLLTHRPYYSGASDEDLKRGRLTQNLWFDDITGINVK